MRYLILSLCTVFAFPAEAQAESPTTSSDTLITLGTRIFDLGEQSPILDLEVENEFVSLTDVEWIEDMTQSDPLLAYASIEIKDHTRMLAGQEPTWLPDDRTRFHLDPTLPQFFDLDGYDVGWSGAREAPVRGDILIIPKDHPERFYARCGYDRAEQKPILCTVNLRYGPDRNLLITTYIWQVNVPLDDFAEIAARVDALVRCLDVTEAVQAREAFQPAPHLRHEDIVAGGRCRISPSS